MSDEKMYDASRFREKQIEYLKILQEGIHFNITREEIIDLLAKGDKCPKNSFILNLEMNIKGLFELNQNICFSLVPLKEYRDLTRHEILDKIIDSINALLREKFIHTKRMFEVKTFRVQYNDALIDVEEIYRNNKTYNLVFKSTNYRSEYYISKYYEFRRSSLIIKMNESDSALIPTFEMDRMEDLISNYR